MVESMEFELQQSPRQPFRYVLRRWLCHPYSGGSSSDHFAVRRSLLRVHSGVNQGAPTYAGEDPVRHYPLP